MTQAITTTVVNTGRARAAAEAALAPYRVRLAEARARAAGDPAALRGRAASLRDGGDQTASAGERLDTVRASAASWSSDGARPAYDQVVTDVVTRLDQLAAAHRDGARTCDEAADCVARAMARVDEVILAFEEAAASLLAAASAAPDTLAGHYADAARRIGEAAVRAAASALESSGAALASAGTAFTSLTAGTRTSAVTAGGGGSGSGSPALPGGGHGGGTGTATSGGDHGGGGVGAGGSGGGEAAPPPNLPVTGDVVAPLQGGTITSEYGMRVHPVTGVSKMHSGLDIAAPTGTIIDAVAAGTVQFAGWRGGYGNTVIIDHGNGVTTLYGHCSQLLVRPGQEIGPGTDIAKVGSTGISTGPHLHFEVRSHGTAVEPRGWLRQQGVRI